MEDIQSSLMDDFQAKKKELFSPLFFEAGAALLDCQFFEYGIALLLFHLSRVGNKGLDAEQLSRILDNKDKKTAGQLIIMLKENGRVSDGIENALQEALFARNRLIHRVLVDNAEQIPQAETRAALVKEIRTLRSKVRRADKMLRPFISAFSEILDRVKQEEMEAEFRKLIS